MSSARLWKPPAETESGSSGRSTLPGGTADSSLNRRATEALDLVEAELILHAISS